MTSKIFFYALLRKEKKTANKLCHVNTKWRPERLSIRGVQDTLDIREPSHPPAILASHPPSFDPPFKAKPTNPVLS